MYKTHIPHSYKNFWIFDFKYYNIPGIPTILFKSNMLFNLLNWYIAAAVAKATTESRKKSEMKFPYITITSFWYSYRRRMDKSISHFANNLRNSSCLMKIALTSLTFSLLPLLVTGFPVKLKLWQRWLHYNRKGKYIEGKCWFLLIDKLKKYFLSYLS